MDEGHQPILGEPSLMGLADRILAPCQAMRRIIEGQGCGGEAAQLWSLYERPVKLPIDLRARFRFRIHVPEAAHPVFRGCRCTCPRPGLCVGRIGKTAVDDEDDFGGHEKSLTLSSCARARICSALVF